MYKCVHGFAPKLLCDMIVMASDVNVRNTRNTDSLNVCIPKPNIECYRKSFKYAGGKIYLIIYRMHHQWRHLNMPIRNLILNTGTLTDGSNVLLHQIFGTCVQHAKKTWTKSDIRFCENEGSNRFKMK